MPNIIKSAKQSEIAELEANKKLKPKLREFVIKQQQQKAMQTSMERRSTAKKVLARNDVLERANKLAVIALVYNQIWRKLPPVLDWRWTRFGPISQEDIEHMNKDVSAFAAYLANEYILNYKQISGEYPNPMQEGNLMFFWQKFNLDLSLTIEADIKQKEKGNQGVIVADKADAS